MHIGRYQFLPIEAAALRIEGLCGQPEKMADVARLVRDFQPPFGTVSEPRDSVADHVRACHCSFVPCRLAIERAGAETPHLQRDAPDFYPSGAGHRHLAWVNRQREEPEVQRKAAAFNRWHEPDDARVSSPDL